MLNLTVNFLVTALISPIIEHIEKVIRLIYLNKHFCFK